MEGAEWLEEATEDTTIEKLKEKCLKHVGWVAMCLCALLSLPVKSLSAWGVRSQPGPLLKLPMSVVPYL